MNKLLKLSCLSLFLALVMSSCSSQKKYSYETVPNDPLKARIYTLDNGLKVYLTVNKETPRIQTFIAVRVGGKNDPAETTGLAHYFEHLMFKGTDKYGTQDYAAEKPLLDQIEQQFEIYRQTTDEAERKAIYHTIDSLSYEASKYAIPNEYDKLMAAIGSSGSNAYTWYDQTVYQEDIPSNQIENWAKIQADRFENNVIRGFHTELEAVYEEKNMSLTRDNSKVQEAIFSSLFPKHPYGTQTVLGTQENLKNPSITNIKNYYKQWYVPNNMAICMSGDLDPDETIALIDKYFSGLKPNPELPKLNLPKEDPIDILEIDNTAVRNEQIAALKELRANRDEAAVQKALADITECVKTKKGNLLELAVKAAGLRASLGEISDACEVVVGRYKAIIRTISGVYSSETKKDADFQKACELCEQFAKKEGRQPRIMIAKMGQDGHDRGAKVVATGYADLGFDVDMGPLFQTPAEAARQAVENDVHVMGVSSLAAGHKTLVPQVIEELKKLGREDIIVIAGGVIPAQDYDFLYKAGVAAIFGPGTSVSKAACQILEILLGE